MTDAQHNFICVAHPAGAQFVVEVIPLFAGFASSNFLRVSTGPLQHRKRAQKQLRLTECEIHSNQILDENGGCYFLPKKGLLVRVSVLLVHC